MIALPLAEAVVNEPVVTELGLLEAVALDSVSTVVVVPVTELSSVT